MTNPHTLVYRSYDVENTGQRFVFVLDIKGEKMYFFVNASPPKPLEIAISNFAGAFVRKKADICGGVPLTEV